MEQKTNKNVSTIEDLIAKIDKAKKYMENASCYYNVYLETAPIILEKAKEQYEEAQETLDNVKVLLGAIDKAQKQIENPEDTKEDSSSIVLTKKPSKK